MLPQNICTEFLDHERESEGEQQFGDVAEPMHAAEAVALDHRAEQPDSERRDDKRRPEADPAADLEAK